MLKNYQKPLPTFRAPKKKTKRLFRYSRVKIGGEEYRLERGRSVLTNVNIKQLSPRVVLAFKNIMNLLHDSPLKALSLATAVHMQGCDSTGVVYYEIYYYNHHKFKQQAYVKLYPDGRVMYEWRADYLYFYVDLRSLDRDLNDRIRKRILGCLEAGVCVPEELE